VADVDNPASQRVLEKAGFVREGVLRKYILLKGRPRDMVIFSIVVDTDTDTDTDTDRRQQQKDNKPDGP
jgi:RimJ/RimL family protein N-acetyltransferase